jgi:4-diphosphocytidyl-2-C-methyl-D-erythritol kinase
MTIARILAPAKLNLGLEILGKRADGYHEIRTIMQAISLYDTLSAIPTADISLIVDRSELDYDDNLVCKAVRSWAKTAGMPRSLLAASLVKRIPTSSGLGGASSDAASALRLANALYRDRLTTVELHRAAASIGSDVAFFLGEATASIAGRGEIIEPLPPIETSWFVLLTPDVAINRKTATMYANLTHADFSDGSAIEENVREAKRGRLTETVQLTNTFEVVLLRMMPELARIPDAFRTLGANRVSLTGAGPTWFAMVDGESDAETLAHEMRIRFPTSSIHIASSLDTFPAVELI